MLIMKVFDPQLWGGKDVGDNSQFWKEAEILHIYDRGEGELLAEVRFLHDGRISTGHFLRGMKTVPQQVEQDRLLKEMVKEAEHVISMDGNFEYHGGQQLAQMVIEYKTRQVN